MNKFIKLYKDKTWLQKMYWENELTLIEIGKLCSVYASTVFEWMKYFNINRRNIPSKKTRDRKSRIQKGKKYCMGNRSACRLPIQNCALGSR